MLKFFRKIRQRLLAENRFIRYALYALGEVFLVILGILIALQINNYYQWEQDRQSELKALIDLKQEFEFNKEHFDEVNAKKLNSLQRNRAFIDLMQQATVDPAALIEARRDVGGFSYTFNPSVGVLQTLISTGEINLVENDSLKYLLTSGNDLVDSYQTEEVLHQEAFSIVCPPYMNAMRNKTIIISEYNNE